MWTLIISLLVIGLALLVIEIVFVPGTTLVGVIGVIFAGAGVLITFREYGSETGIYMLVGSSAITAAALYFSFRSNAWKRFANNSAIRSKVNEGLTATLALGDEGMTLSTLKPMGKAQFKSGEFEVKTLGDYVDVGTKVKIVHIESNQIIVKPLN
ncbi:MAG TPA: NfeD family protein [Chryseosolibacter sp.]|nr:NfeD family protein [Chryseosolibacter sp.]